MSLATVIPLRAQAAHYSEAAPPPGVPRDYVGPVLLPGSGRMVWWTGRVAIGLLHQRAPAPVPPTRNALWLQALLLRERPPALKAARKAAR